MPHSSPVFTGIVRSSYGTHLLDHLAADRAGLAGGEVAVVALLEVNANFLWCTYIIKILGQHRTIWQAHSAKDFASYESYKRAGILYVFPPFITARMGQKIGRRPQTQLCGDALEC